MAHPFLAWARSTRGTRTLRYLAVSAMSVVLGQLVLALAFSQFGWTARWSNFVGFVVAALPSYYLNRAWAWGKTGRSHLLREVVPFWVIAVLGLVFSTAAVGFAEDRTASLSTGHSAERTALIMTASLGAGVVLWIAKYVIFNRYLFSPPRPTDRGEEQGPGTGH